MYIVNLAASDLTFSLINGFPLMTVASFNKGWFWGDIGKPIQIDRVAYTFITGRIAASGKLPVLNLFTGRKSAFSPAKATRWTDSREIWHDRVASGST